MHDALAILRFLADRSNRGERVALVTLTGITGSSARAPGDQMAVAQDGSSAGSFSGGCVEAAVIAEAQDVLAAGAARQVRFGAESPYIDIRLPCGGGIDLLFTPDPDPDQIAAAISTLESRSPIVLRLTTEGGVSASRAVDGEATGWVEQIYYVRHDPRLRLLILGHGAEPEALIDQALAYGADVMLLSPQAALVASASARNVPAVELRTLGRSGALRTDRWTAVIALFHDHDWETDLLGQALEQEAFFIGAMGSRKTHAERIRRLAHAGYKSADLDRVVGPIGLIRATRDPRTLAVSIMAQVVDELVGAKAIVSGASLRGKVAA